MSTRYCAGWFTLLGTVATFVAGYSFAFLTLPVILAALFWATGGADYLDPEAYALSDLRWYVPILPGGFCCFAFCRFLMAATSDCAGARCSCRAQKKW